MYFEPCLQLPRENENSEWRFHCSRVLCIWHAIPPPQLWSKLESDPRGVQKRNQPWVWQPPPWRFLRALGASSPLLVFFFADAEDITSGPALVREHGGLVPTDVCVRTDEGFRALCRRSLGSLLPKLFSAGLPNPSWTAAKLAAYLKQQVGLQCAVTPVRV